MIDKAIKKLLDKHKIDYFEITGDMAGADMAYDLTWYHMNKVGITTHA
jgi:hypothetical protein